MRKCDLGILLLAAFAVFLSLQHNGDFSFREAWYHLSDQDYPIKYEADRLPPPLVADLNSDGKPEILLPTVNRSYKHPDVRKQVLVVVTSGWTVMCFDHNLKKLWEANLQDDFPHGAHHREVAISVTNYTLKHGDVVLVIVGGRMEMQHHKFVEPLEPGDLKPENTRYDAHPSAAEEKILL